MLGSFSFCIIVYQVVKIIIFKYTYWWFNLKVVASCWARA